VSGQGRSLRSTIALYWGLAARHNYAGIFRLLASDPRDYFRGREGAFYGFCCGRYVTGWEEARWKLSERNELPGRPLCPLSTRSRHFSCTACCGGRTRACYHGNRRPAADARHFISIAARAVLVIRLCWRAIRAAPPPSHLSSAAAI